MAAIRIVKPMAKTAASVRRLVLVITEAPFTTLNIAVFEDGSAPGTNVRNGWKTHIGEEKGAAAESSHNYWRVFSCALRLKITEMIGHAAMA